MVQRQLQAGKIWVHHLVPAGVWKRNIEIARLAYQDGWRPDNPSNLIGLPADEATKKALDDLLPIHKFFHPKYDMDTQALIDAERRAFPSTLTPLQAHAILQTVAMLNLGRIFARKYHETMKSA